MKLFGAKTCDNSFAESFVSCFVKGRSDPVITTLCEQEDRSKYQTNDYGYDSRTVHTLSKAISEDIIEMPDD